MNIIILLLIHVKTATKQATHIFLCSNYSVCFLTCNYESTFSQLLKGYLPTAQPFWLDNNCNLPQNTTVTYIATLERTDYICQDRSKRVKITRKMHNLTSCKKNKNNLANSKPSSNSTVFFLSKKPA